MKKIAYFSDIAFAFCAAFLPTLCFLRFKRLPMILSVGVALLFAVGISLTVAATMKKRNAARTLKAREEREKDMLALHLAMLTQEEQTRFFAERSQTVFEEECQATKQNEWLFLETDTRVGLCRFRATPVNADEALPIVTHSTEKTPVLLCNELSDDGKSLLQKFGVQALTVEELYLKLRAGDCLPSTYKSEPAFSKRKARIFSGFTKRNSQPFFRGGALVLVSSLITPFPYYYLVFGILLTSVAVFIRVFAKK